jgi:hypothetical protein
VEGRLLTGAHVSLIFSEPKAGYNIDASPCFAVSFVAHRLGKLQFNADGDPAFLSNLANRTQSLASFQPGI